MERTVKVFVIPVSRVPGGVRGRPSGKSAASATPAGRARTGS